MANFNGQGMLSSAIFGLNNAYSVLAKNNKNGGLSIEDLQNPSNTALQQLGGNSSFTQFLSSNFAAIAGKDGKIDANDMTNLTNKLSQNGLSYEEICQLCSSGAMGNSSLTNTVLTYFNQMDKDKNGRVTNAEIQSFSLKSDEEKMKTEYGSFKSSSMSVFYGDEDSSDDKPTSLVNKLYPDD